MFKATSYIMQSAVCRFSLSVLFSFNIVQYVFTMQFNLKLFYCLVYFLKDREF